MNEFAKLNLGFHQVNANLEKMGAYYTDEEHCKQMAPFFAFPDSEVTILEPSIGDAKAVCAVVGKETGDNKHIFGVELNAETVKKLRASEIELEALVEADYLEGTKIRSSSFSFCFGNPPYMEEVSGREGRMEKLFLEKVYTHLKKQGVLCWVIPWNVFREDTYFRYMYSRFELKHIYKFHEREYKKYHQVVIMGIKKTNISYRKEDFEAFSEKYASIDNVPELPEHYDGEKIPVPSGKNSDVNPFTSKVFPAEEVFERLQTMNNMATITKRLSVPRFQLVNCGNPPMPPKKDHLFTLAVAGIGQGMAGKGATTHLQRGVCKLSEKSFFEQGEDGKYYEKVVQQTTTSMVVLEQDGTFTELV